MTRIHVLVAIGPRGLGQRLFQQAHHRAAPDRDGHDAR